MSLNTIGLWKITLIGEDTGTLYTFWAYHLNIDCARRAALRWVKAEHKDTDDTKYKIVETKEVKKK